MFQKYDIKLELNSHHIDGYILLNSSDGAWIGMQAFGSLEVQKQKSVYYVH